MKKFKLMLVLGLSLGLPQAFVQAKECYKLELKNLDGKQRKIEPVCRVLEKNLNQFCNEPPMVCGIKIAPKFRIQLILPAWTLLDIDENRQLINEFLKQPLEDAYPKDRENVLAEELSQLEAAIDEKRLSFSKSNLDLYNLGKRQIAYRLDYGSCKVDNQHLNDKGKWDFPVTAAHIQVQHAPNVSRQIFSRYFPIGVTTFSADTFTFAGQTYTYAMAGSQIHLGPSQLVVSRTERKKYSTDRKETILARNVCVFNYISTVGVAK